ncbi:MAG: hypothetical protein ABW321_23390, partial [Polyangiales bacterium]
SVGGAGTGGQSAQGRAGATAPTGGNPTGQPAAGSGSGVAGSESPDSPDSGAPDASMPAPAGSGGDPDSPPPTDDEVSEIANQLAGALCSGLRDCLGAQALAAFVGRSECETRYSTALAQGEFVTLADSVERGRVKLQRDQLPQCYADMRELGCRYQAERTTESCKAAIQGQVAEGGTCSSSSDCSGNTYCSSGECPRVCTARSDAGGACVRDDGECNTGLICRGQTCVTPAAVDEACAGTSGGYCAHGTTCLGGTTMQSGVCKPNAEVLVGGDGAVCSPAGTLCQEGLSCVFDGATGFVCRAAVGSGGSCQLGLPTQCPSDEYCNSPDVTVAGQCAKLPVEGEPCVLAGECAAGHVCLAVSDQGVCNAVHDLGEPCTQDVLCHSGRCVDGACAGRPVCE